MKKNRPNPPYTKNAYESRRHKILIASKIIDSLPEVTKQTVVARMLGLKRMTIYRIERIAIYKIYAALKTTVIKDTQRI